MTRRLLSLLCLAAMLFASAGSSLAKPPAGAFRVKAPKGRKSGLSYAVHPDSGNVFLVFENRSGNTDRIYSALAKRSGNGRYKAKKAKPISGTGAHRPYAVYDSEGNSYVAAWDTGPRDLFIASEASEILLRKARVRNGKGQGPTLSRGVPGDVNLSPRFFPSASTAGDDDFGLVFVHGPASGRSGRTGHTSRAAAKIEYKISGHVNRMIRFADDAQPMATVEGPGRITSAYKFPGRQELAIGYEAHLSGDLRNAYIWGVENFDKPTRSQEGPFGTPPDFPNVDTSDPRYAGGVDMVFAGVSLYCENGRTWAEFHTSPDWAHSNQGPLGDFSTCETSAPSVYNPYNLNTGRRPESRTPRMDAVYVAGSMWNGKVQLFVLDDDGVGEPRNLFDHNKLIREIRLVLSFDSNQAVVFWIEARTDSSDEIYGYAFDLEG